MKSIVCAISLMALSSAAFADGRAGNSPSNSNAHANSHAVAAQSQSQSTSFYSVGGTGYSEGSNASIQVSSPDTVTVRQAPDVNAPPAYATSPCRIAVSGGVSFLTGGVSLGGSTHDEECSDREWVRVLDSIGERQMALNIACNNERVRKSNPLVCKTQ